MPTVTSVNWADQHFELLAGKAVFWPARSSLILADPHFGKADHFRHAGIPVPWGTTDANLRRLDALLDATRAERLLVLGDLFHARTGQSDAMLDRLAQWRRTRSALSIVTVRGNHDRHAGDPPEPLAITCVGDEWIEDTLVFRHEPQEDPADRWVMAGHVHPAVWLHAPGQPGMRLPCFSFGRRVALLPAFGAFTGMRAIRPRRGDRIFAVGPDEVLDVSPCFTSRNRRRD